MSQVSNNGLTLDAASVMSLFGFMVEDRDRRIYDAGELLNDQTAGSAADVQQQARVEMAQDREISKIETQREKHSRDLARNENPSSTLSAGPMDPTLLQNMVLRA